MKKSLLIFCLLLAACGHHRDVRPGAKVNSVTVKNADDADGARDALAQAQHYCGQWDKQAVITEEKANYTGSMDESTYKVMKSASKAAKTVGASIGASEAASGQMRRGKGEQIGMGGMVIDDIAGEGYTVQMQFVCR